MVVDNLVFPTAAVLLLRAGLQVLLPTEAGSVAKVASGGTHCVVVTDLHELYT